MTTFQLTARARNDLKTIGRYTLKKWGKSQRDSYLRQIDAAFFALAENPDKGRSCDDIRPEYFKYRVGHHFVFYRVSPSRIEIIRILHERMDVSKHFT